MVDVTSRLRLVVDSSGVDKSGRKLRDLRREAKRADEQARKLQSAFAGLAAVVGTAFSVQQITRAVDEYRNIENQLKLVTRSAEELRRAQEGVLQVANETGATLESTARLYGNLERFAGEFLSTQQEALDLTRAINQAAAISGASVTEASNAVRQLSQGIAGGILRAEEFNSIVENMPRLAEAIADGLGVGLGELRRQVNDGLITSQTLVESLQSQFGNLNTEFLGTARTIGQAMQGLRNILTVEIGQRFQGVQDIAVSALQAIGQNIDTLIPLVEGLGAALLIVGSRFAFTGAAAALGALLSPLGLVAAGIATIVAFRDDIAGLVTGFDNAAAVVRVLASDLMSVLVPAVQSIRTAFDNIMQIVGPVAKFILTAFGTAFDFVVGNILTIAEVISPVFTILRNDVARIAEFIVTVFERARDAVVKMLQDLVLSAQQIAITLDIVSNPLGTALGDNQFNISKTVLGLSSALGELTTKGREARQALTEGLTDGPGEDLSQYFKNVGDRAEELVKQLEEAEAAGGGFAGQMEKAAKSTGKAVDNAKSMAAHVERLAETSAAAFGAVGGNIGNARLDADFQAIAREAYNTFDRITDELRRTFENGLIDEDQYRKLYNEAHTDLKGILEDSNDRQQRLFEDFQSGLTYTFDGIINDFIFNGGSGFVAILQRGFEDLVTRNIIEPFTDGIFGGEGIGKLGDIFQGTLENFSKTLQNVGFSAGQAGALAGLGAAGTAGFLGYGIGSTIGSLIRPEARADNQAFGGLAGGTAGFLLGGGVGAVSGVASGAALGTLVAPVIGTLVGAILGTVGGSLFGKSSSNFGRVQLDASGNIISQSAKDKGRGDENLRRAQDFASGITQIIGEIERITGGQSNGLRTGIQFDDRSGISFLAPGTDQVVRSFGNDAQAAMAYILGRAIQGLSGGDEELVAEAKRLAAQNQSADQLVESLERLLAKRDLENQITQRLLNNTDPLLGTLSQLSTSFGELTKQAESLGVNTGPGSDLNKLLAQDLASTLEQSGVGIVELRSRFDELVSSLDGVANASEIVSQALDKVASSQRDAFNEQIQSDIGRFLDGPLDQLEALLKAQEQRLMEAKALGADLAQVERLTNLEMREFFQGLSDDALKEVESFLGLFNDATNAVVRNLDLSRQDLQSQADAFGRFAQDFANLNSSLQEQFIAASPRESIAMLQGRASELLGQVRDGNQSAAQALPQVINQLVQNARSTFGNTAQFTEILNGARNILSEAETAALAVQSDAERQIAALDENNDILADIRDILQSGQAVNAFFQSSANGGIASAEELLKIIQSGTGIAGAANDNATALSVTSLIGQSIQPIIVPLTNSIDNFTQKLSDMPSLQQLTIEAIDRGSDKVADEVSELKDVLERIEAIQKKQLTELEEQAA